LNSKLHAVVDNEGKPVLLFLSAGQVSDYKGARQLLGFLSNAKVMLADRGYDADWFRQALEEKGITPCIPTKKNRKKQILYDKELYRKRHKVENMFAKLKDWRRIATRYDRCAHTFFSAICIAATFCFYLN
jgi:transposase